MTVTKARRSVALCLSGLLLGTLSSTLFAQGSTGGVQADAVITVMGKHGKELRPITREAVNVGGNGSEVQSWTPLTGSRAALQLLILLDDSSSSRVDNQLSDIRRFLLSLPPTTEVAIGYMQNGRALMTQNFTSDHAAAGKTLRYTMGIPGGNGSPYFTLRDVIKRWPSQAGASANRGRREILMVTDGVDRYSGARFDPENPYVISAIRDAQRSGILIHSIYYRGAGALDANQNVTFGGQSYLEEVSTATGGRCYTEGLGNPVSFRPFLDELSERLQNQYELSFITGERPEHGLVSFKLKIQAPGASVNAPEMAHVSNSAASAGSAE